MIALSLIAGCRPHQTSLTRDAAEATPLLVAGPTDAFAAEVDAPRDEPIERRASGAFGIVVASKTAEPPVVLYLHGMWASPEDSCSFFERAAAEAVLVCPRGNAPAESGGAWRGTLLEKRRSIDAALEVAKDLVRPRTLATSGGVAMGFSSGAALALELALAAPGRWSGLVLMSMKLQLDPARLKTAGVKRVALAAGDLDGSQPSMVQNQKMLAAAGVDARFFTLGPVGHHFAANMESRMVDVLAWVRAP